MIKNYFFLNRFVTEINEKVKDFNIISIFSQEKNMLIIELAKGNFKLFIEININPGFPYITLKENCSRAKKNTLDFFQHIYFARCESFEIADMDRIIRLTTDKGNLYFFIRGKFTNVCFIDDNKNIGYFKNPPEENNDDVFRNELGNLSYRKDFNFLPQLEYETLCTFNSIREKYPVVGKEILLEAKCRCKTEKCEEIKTNILKAIGEIKKNPVAINLNVKDIQINLCPAGFNAFKLQSEVIFDDVVSAFNFYIGKKFFLEQFSSKKRRIQKYLDKELQRLTSKLNNLNIRIENGSKESLYSSIGNLLLIHREKIKAGMTSIKLEDILNPGNILNIKLDEKLSVQKNIDRYFEKSRNEKINIQKSKELFTINTKKLNFIKNINSELDEAKEIEALKKIMKELNMKDDNERGNNQDLKIKFKQYIIENKYFVFVGKDSKNNDLLTTKFAKQNDYWFHARSVPGSHVLLRVENTKEAIPKNILKKAAALAAFHSKAKTAGVAPVSYTLKKYVIKKKNMEPGKVAMLKEEVLLVKPEIPAGCEFVTDDDI